MVVNMHLSETWHSKEKRLSPIPNSGLYLAGPDYNRH